MISIEHNTLYIQSVNNIRLMQHLRGTEGKRDPRFAELLGTEMRAKDADRKRTCHAQKTEG